MFVCAVLVKENLVCAAAMVCAIVTLIVSIFMRVRVPACVCVCVYMHVAGGPFRRAGHFRAAVGPPQADGDYAATSHTVYVPVCVRERNEKSTNIMCIYEQKMRWGADKKLNISHLSLCNLCASVCFC